MAIAEQSISLKTRRKTEVRIILGWHNRVVVSKDSEAVKKKIVNAGGNFADSGEEFYPKSVYDALHILKDYYKVDIPVIIAENGCRDVSEKTVDGKIRDEYRIRYIRGFLEWIHKAMEEGIDVRGYYLWSPIDNFEWTAGYEYKFGIAANDRNTQKRTLKESACAYSEIIKNNGFLI